MNDHGEFFDPLEAQRSLLEAASWRLVAELARRHPEQVRIIETHPGGGQYDCLAAVTREADPTMLLEANRAGSIHLGPAGEAGDIDWAEYLTAEDPRSFMLEVERRIGLDAPSRVPATTPLTVTWRAIAHATAAGLLDINGLTVRNGVEDTSSYGVGVRDELFGAIPGAREAARQQHDYDPYGEAAYRFWFLITNDEPAVAIEAETSRTWWVDGTELNLYEQYAANGRRLAAAVADVFAPALA